MKWESKTLGEICTFRSGVGFKLEYQGDNAGDYPFIKVSDMNLSENQIRINTANNWISGTVRERISAEPFQAGTTVFAKIGEALKQNRVRLLVRDTIIDNNMMGAIPNPEMVEAEFLYHRLSMFDFAATSSGAALPFLTVKVLAESRVSIPPLPVQREIADVLSTYDELLENNRRRMELLEESARLLYREWFVRLRFPGHEHARLTNGIPQGWARVPLGERVTLNYGNALKADERIDGPFPVYGSSGIVGSHEKPLVNGPGIILGRKGNVGSVFWSSKDFYAIDTVYFVDAQTSNLYLFYALKDMHFISTDVAVPGLNRDFAYSRPLVIPAKLVLRQFLEAVSPMHEQMEKLDEMNQKLRAARDLLLPRLMSGEIAV